MPKLRKQSAATLAKKARAKEEKVTLQNSAEKPHSIDIDQPGQEMTESTSDVEVMDVQESDESAVNSSVHPEKENGFCTEDAPNDILVKKPSLVNSSVKSNDDDDVIQSNSNHDADATGDEDTANNDLATEDKSQDDETNETKLHQNNLDEKDTKSTELKEPNASTAISQILENHKDNDSVVNINETETPANADSPSSTVNSKKQPSTEESNKPNSIPDRMLDLSPKCSPETIVADDAPLVGKTDTSNSSVSKTKMSEVEVNENTQADKETTNSTNADSEEKESESKTKHESKSGGKKEGDSGGKKKKGKTCAQCGQKKKLHFRIVFQGKAYQLCSEVCFKDFKQKQSAPKPPVPEPVVAVDIKCAQCQKKITSGQGYFPVVGEVKALCSEECIKKYHDHHGPPRNCSQCKKKIESVYNQLTWETMVFCNEDCLGKYQSFLGSHCTCCQTPVQQTSLGKYCVCFGADIRQFCSGTCLEEFKKGLKVCSFCQTDLSAGTDGFLAPVGDKGQFKDFCSQQCMERYEGMNNLSKTVPDVQECSHCKKQGSFKIQVKHEDKMYSLCCDICVAGFRCSFKVKDKMCDTCFKFFKPGENENFSLKFEGAPKHFCTKACMTLFVLSHRKIIQCVQCKVKKYTFDMIERISENNTVQMYCSLNCLSLFRVNLSATSSKCIRCDNCTKNIPAQYHLTMSDGSIRNFCTYQCVLFFQNQFTTVPALTTSTATRQSNTLKTGIKTTSSNSTPVIANVVSLAQPRPVVSAPGKGLVPQTLVSVRQQGPSLAVLSPKSQVVSSSTVTSTTISVAAPSAGNPPVMREIVVRPPVPKSVKNKSASCKPIMQTKGVNAKLQTCHKAVQTDERPMPLILPVPVPIYVPTPMHMFSRPVPCPVPFPVPIPVPIIIQSSKAYKDIQENAPAHSYEADLLKMAEIVAEANSKGQKGSSKSVFKPQAKDMEGPQKDAPSRAADQANTHSVNNAGDKLEPSIEPEDDNNPKENKSKHRNKRGGDLKQKEAKKPKLDNVNNLDPSADDAETNKQIAEMMSLNFEDTDTKLKYAFGVNAWRQWIMEKNGQSDKGGGYSAKKLKLFKNDILQLSSDELNYSLSLFVKEITRPTGERYTAGALFYLILGIQLYLHENGRIDNLFADECFNQFTDHFHEILVEYENRALAQQVPWSRIEEEFLWDSRQLGAHSPQVLLNTLIYFNTKYFKMKTTADHVGLCFPHIGRHVERERSRNGNYKGYLRYYGPFYDAAPTRKGNCAPSGKGENFQGGNSPTVLPLYSSLGEKGESGAEQEERETPRRKLANGFEEDEDEEREEYDDEPHLVQPENNMNHLRCPVRLYEFYISKCPPNVLDKNSRFYLSPDKSCVPDNPIWYTTTPLPREAIAKTLQRVKLIEELYEE